MPKRIKRHKHISTLHIRATRAEMLAWRKRARAEGSEDFSKWVRQTLNERTTEIDADAPLAK